ncbi:hypothetical protein [Schleiferilactobacillus harbinensis]|uniref:hypothetical protein n=1 Tax=Schleiferilactobacillus harbinensis TaxID=304207 RepID=UPI00186B994F|nr:hypothetical protein [Schleiferilactobacillus harbinensis]
MLVIDIPSAIIGGIIISACWSGVKAVLANRHEVVKLLRNDWKGGGDTDDRYEDRQSPLHGTRR